MHLLPFILLTIHLYLSACTTQVSTVIDYHCEIKVVPTFLQTKLHIYAILPSTFHFDYFIILLPYLQHYYTTTFWGVHSYYTPVGELGYFSGFRLARIWGAFQAYHNGSFYSAAPLI